MVLSAEKIIMPLIAAVQSPMEREHFIGVVARALGSTPDAVRGSLKKSVSTVPSVPSELVPNKSFSVPTTYLSGREHRTSLLHAIWATYPDSDLAKRVESEYIRINGAPFPDLVPDERWLFEAGLAYGETPSESSADDLLHAFVKIVTKY